MSDNTTVGATAVELVRVAENDHTNGGMSDAQRATIVDAVRDDLATAAATAVNHEERLVAVEKLTHALADIAITAGDAVVAALPAVQALKADLARPPDKRRTPPGHSHKP